MVNFNNATKMMVNRCMELLNAKIAHAQTRHIARRVPVRRFSPRTLDTKAMYRERKKTEKYEASKRLSMWEQEKDQSDGAKMNSRLDHSHYKHHGVNERTYDCTWVNFPEEPQPRTRPESRHKDNAPIKRRKTGQRPQTAKPWDAEAKDFIRQWDTNSATINRNRYSRSEDISPSPTNGNKQLRRKIFYY